MTTTEAKSQTHSLAIHIGNRISMQRRAMRVSLREAAEGIGTSYPYLHFMENGKRIPSPQLLLKLSRYFRVSVSYFFEGF